MVVKNLILYPGGIKGLCYSGSIFYLDNNNILSRLEKICGISIGSIIGYMISIGCDGIEIFSEINKEKFDLGTPNIGRLFTDHGIYESTSVNKFLEKISIKYLNSIPTFEKLYRITGIEFEVIAYDMDDRKSISFSYHTHPDMIVISAIMYSINIPVLLTRKYHNGNTVLDGAISLRSVLEKYNPEESLIIRTRNDLLPGVDFISYIMNIIQIMIEEQHILLEKCYQFPSIIIDCPYNTTFGTELKVYDRSRMFVAGYRETKNYYTSKITEDITTTTDVPIDTSTDVPIDTSTDVPIDTSTDVPIDTSDKSSIIVEAEEIKVKPKTKRRKKVKDRF